MSLRPAEIAPVPAATAQVAAAAFPKGCAAMRMRDELGTVYDDRMFASLYPVRGQPAHSPWRLALVTVLQFTEGLSDRQAADAVRGRIDWKYALGLELTDPGFDFSVLCEFRARLIAGRLEQALLDAMLAHLRERDLLKARGRQRTDSTHVLAAVRAVNRLESVGETLRAALNALASVAPDWLAQHADAEWPDRYGRPFEEWRLPKGEGPRKVLGEQIGRDGHRLLAAAYDPSAPSWLRALPAVQTLRRAWVNQFYVEDTASPGGLPRDWGSGCGGDFGERVVRGEEALPEAGAERAVVNGAADLEQPIGTAPRPAHLLRFVHATIDQKIGRVLGQRRANPQPGPVPFAVVDQPLALPDEVAVQRPQRGPQLARGRGGSAAAGLATEVVHYRTDAIDAELRILGLAVPQPPAQALDLLDDHRLRGSALRTIGRQASGNLRQVLQPHGDMKPVEYRKPLDASVEKNAPQPGTAVGKRRQRCALGPPDRIKAAADQACEIRVGLRYGTEDLPSSARRLDIADPNLQPPLAGLATPNEGRIQGHHDRLGAGRRRLHPHLRWERLGDLERVAAKGLRIRAGVHREHLPQHLGGRPIGH